MNPKAINALSARVARIEALMEDNDVFKQQGVTTYGGLDYQGSQFGGIQFGDNYFQSPESQRSDYQQEQSDNYGFGPTESTVNDLMQRISELELLVAGGSNDTRQSEAQDADQTVVDDASQGTGTAGGIPAGYGPVDISVCVGGVAMTMTVIGTTPV